ncbi:DNRLRE domain-containing protein [Sphaerisporangium sp. NPDC051017]|uniref:DNRLRE domain-containing protein n=1 Tax=Sphaerisporangium sp. NPDC051017 TaxID=3154636 RepID=UPI00343BAA79
MAKATARAKGSPVEVTSARREDSTLYTLPNGTYRVEMHSGPIRVEKNGHLIPIDVSLVQEGGRLKPKAAKSAVEFSLGGQAPLVSFSTGAGTHAVSWPSNLTKPDVAGNTATYRDAVPGGDLVLTATPTGFTQDLVLRERPQKPINLRIPVSLPKGQHYKRALNGNLTLSAANGETLASAPPLQMHDSAAERSPDSGHTATVPAEVEKSGEGSTFVLRPDQKFLAAPDVQYPVVISMSHWVGAGLKVDTFVSSDYPNSQTGATWLHAGKFGNGSKTARTYIRFNAGLPLRGVTVLNADLRLWNYKSNACGTSVESGIQVRRITSDWSPSTLTLSNQPSTTTTGALIEKAAAGEPDCAENEIYYSIESIVQDWANGAADYGVQLRAANESDSTNWRMYRSSESAGTGPVLYVDFQTDAPEQVGFTLYAGAPGVPLDGSTFSYYALQNIPGMSNDDLSELVRTGTVTREFAYTGDPGEEWPQIGDPEAHPRVDEPQDGEPMDEGPTPTPTPTPTGPPSEHTLSLPVTSDTWIDDQGAGSPSSASVWAGTWSLGPAKLKERSYLKFDTSLLAGKNITDAKLELWATGGEGCGVSNSGIKVQRVTSNWDAVSLRCVNGG